MYNNTLLSIDTLNNIYPIFFVLESPKCHFMPDIGPCKGQFSRYYYDYNKQNCHPFIYGGCRGNRNNFRTYDECMTACRIGKYRII